jgi:type 1 glutamine amidotransferase
MIRYSFMRRLLIILLLASLSAAAAEPQNAKDRRVLVFSKTLGFRHSSITNGIIALRELGMKHGFAVEATEDASAFNASNLARFQAVAFLSVTGDVLDSNQQAALKNYLEAGGGLVAIHGAIFGPQACEDQWAWYGQMFCCSFTNHSAVVPATVIVQDMANPSASGLPTHWQRTDEWYNYTHNPRSCSHVIAVVDEATYRGGLVGKDHPITWCRRVGQGRMWYTAMGHTESSFSEPLFVQHLLGGIRLAAGWAVGEFEP